MIIKDGLTMVCVINDACYESVLEWAQQPHENGRIAFFAEKGSITKDTIFMIAHGSENGLIQLGNTYYTPEAVLRGLIQDGIVDRRITKVYTVCCHGGSQSTVTIDWCTMESYHTSLDDVFIEALYNEAENVKMVRITLL